MPDTLIDAGPLIAVINRNDNWHRQCAALLRQLDTPLLTTLPALTEAMHLLGRNTGAAGQAASWRLALRGDLVLEHPTMPDLQRMADLTARYADCPMDFADASLAAIAERLNLERIVTLDRSDFSIYRLYDRKSFVIVGPG